MRWESSLIYQYIYKLGSLNSRFVPIIFTPEDHRYVPMPLQSTTFYFVNSEEGYNDLYYRLLGIPKVEKPRLGKRKALPPKEVKTDVAMFLSSPIDLELWDKAK